MAGREAQLLDYDRGEAHCRVLQLDPVDMSEGMVGELRYTLAAGGAPPARSHFPGHGVWEAG